MADVPSTSAAGRVIDASLDDAKAELKKSVQRVLIQKLKSRKDEVAEGSRNQLVRVSSAGAISTNSNGTSGKLLSSDSQVAKYLRERGYEYTLSVLMAEANVPDSNALKSIATRLNDSRSRLVLGNPEFQAAVLQIWDETEKKYNEKLRQYIIDWEMKQTMQLKQMERILRRRLLEEEQEMKRELSNRLLDVEAKEKELQNAFHERAAAFEHQLDQDKRQLLANARELDGKRQDLQSLETEFNRQVEAEQNRIRMVKENLNQLSAELKRQQLQLTFQMDDAVKEARRQEQIRYAEKLQQISQKEEKIRGIIEKAKASRGQVDALKFMLNERDGKVQELEMIAQQYKGELIKYQDRLREREEQLRRMNDYELLKSENARIKDESRQTREVLAKEKLQLQQRNFELEAQCRDLAARMEEWKPSEENPFRKELIRLKMEFEKARSEWKTNETHYRKQLEEEKAKNDWLKSSLDEQAGRLQSLVEEVKKLQFQLTKRRVMGDTMGVGDRITRREMSLDEIEDMEEEDPTPDYLKEAKRRLRLLERETETFEESVRRYQQKAIDSSSMAVWQAQTASSAYGVAYRTRNEEPEPPFNAVRWVDQGDYTPAATRGRSAMPEPAEDQDLRPRVAAGQPRREEPVQDDWETRLKKREEERRQKDDELRRQQEEELRKMRETERQPSTSASVAQQQVEPQTAPTPAVDPVLQKYMQMVLEQRQKEKEKEPAIGEEAAPVVKPSQGPKEQEVEVGSIKEASSESDFEW